MPDGSRKLPATQASITLLKREVRTLRAELSAAQQTAREAVQRTELAERSAKEAWTLSNVASPLLLEIARQEGHPGTSRATLQMRSTAEATWLAESAVSGCRPSVCSIAALMRALAIVNSGGSSLSVM